MAQAVIPYDIGQEKSVDMNFKTYVDGMEDRTQSQGPAITVDNSQAMKTGMDARVQPVSDNFYKK
jgi:hypothetical protein